MVTNSNSHEFQRDVIQAQVPTIVDFWAPWCGPCMTIAPILEHLAKQYEGKVNVGKVNVDENPQRAAQYRIQAIPTMIAFHDGERVDQMVGLGSRSALEQWFEKLSQLTVTAAK